MSAIFVAVVLSLIAIVGSTIFHYEALSLIETGSRWPYHRHVVVPAVLTLVIFAHLIEIGGYALAFMLAMGPLELGSFSGLQPNALGLFYYAAETYSSLGAGDVFAHGAARLIVSIASINGLLLLAWSGAFLYAFTTRLRSGK